MPRVRWVDALARERQDAAASFAEAAKRKGPRKAKARPKKQVTAELGEMVKTGQWDEALPVHLVALYALLHQHVYGVRPAELDRSGEAGSRERMGAVSSAKKLVADEFAGDIVEAVRFVRWAWHREGGREKWAREKKVERSRLSWRALFAGRGILSDYRVAQERLRAHR